MSVLSLLLLTCFAFAADASSCDKDHPCQPPLVCRYINYIPGAKACVEPAAQADAVPGKKLGRCPPSGMKQLLHPAVAICNSHEDCGPQKRCCPLAYGYSASCIDSQPISPQPYITQLVEGKMKMQPDIMFVASSTLVQSNGINMIVDAGTMRTGDDMLHNLWSKAGLTAEDIDTVVTTHGHADHYANVMIFSNADMATGPFISNGVNYKMTPLAKNQQFFLNNDPNLELIKTPGHTSQDISLIVRNVPGMGTVSLVGDLMLAKDDGGDSFAANRTQSDESRKRVACMSNWIIPGHGSMFQMDASQKLKFAC